LDAAASKLRQAGRSGAQRIRVGELVEVGGQRLPVGEGGGDGGLPVDFRGQQCPGDPDADGGVGGGGLRAAQPRVVAAGGAGGQQQPAVGVQLDDGDAGVGAPTDGVEADAAGVAEQHDPRDGALGAG